MFFWKFFLTLSLTVQCLHGFVNFEEGKEYIFKFNFKDTSTRSNQPNPNKGETTALLHVRKLSNEEFLMFFDDLKTDKHYYDAEFFKSPMKVGVDGHEFISFTGKNNIGELYDRIRLIKEFLKDYSGLAKFASDKIVDKKYEAVMPFGICRSVVDVTKHDTTIEITAKASKPDCDVDEVFKHEFRNKSGTLQEISNSSNNQVTIKVDSNDNQIKALTLHSEIELIINYENTNLRYNTLRTTEFELFKVEDVIKEIILDDDLITLNRADIKRLLETEE
jgi:hypothetical protein